jgi:hypothetical protein
MNARRSVVTCYAGARFPERPRSFSYQGKRLEVAQVEHQERTPRGLRIRVRVADDRRFWLTYDQVHDAWEVRLSRLSHGQGDVL